MLFCVCVCEYTVCEEEWRRVAAAAAESSRVLGMPSSLGALRTPNTPLGAPLLLSPRLPSAPAASAPPPHAAHPGHHPASLQLDHQLIYAGPYAEYAANYAALAANPLLSAEYAAAADHTGGLFAR